MKEEYGKFIQVYSLFSMDENHRRIKKLNILINQYSGDKEDLQKIFHITKKINKQMKLVEIQHPLRQSWERYFWCLVKGKIGGHYQVDGIEAFNP